MSDKYSVNMNKILKYAGLPALVLLTLLITLLGVNTGRQPNLQPWHYMSFPSDNLTDAEYSSFEEYLSVEQDYIDNIYSSLAEISTQEFIRYTEGDVFSPVIDGDNQNSSFILSPRGDEFKGGVLLVHGLSDSPYHMRRIGEFLSYDGYYVIGLRLPGHGTVPSALLDVSWQDWYQAVEFAAGFVQKEISRRGSGIFVMGGFSTGAALNLRYSLEQITEGGNKLPDKLLFFSPAFGITPYAYFTKLHEIFSWIPSFYKFKWQSIEPEYDPYRYSSWSFNAGYQIYRLAKKNWKLVKKVSSRDEYLEKVPPMIAFQSRLDATVLPEKVYELYDLIAPAASQLFIFDVNRRYRSILPDDVLNWSVNMIPGDRVKDMIRTIPGDGSWPESIYAVSHLSVPISEEDAVYGENSLIGGLNLKGEKAVLKTGIDFERLRYNPFFPEMEEKVMDFVSE
ncbi:MAG: hypothetical protein DRP70_08375 [Spirochaetes bacterium]|nr:MAG: hypothetical protein DRP70_08375 [Spirochaetota bacterium]